MTHYGVNKMADIFQATFSKCISRKRRPRYQGPWGQHGAHLGPTGPRWAPCGPREPCYLGSHILVEVFRWTISQRFHWQYDSIGWDDGLGRGQWEAITSANNGAVTEAYKHRRVLSHWDQVTRISVSEVGHHWFTKWPVACSVSSHEYLNQCCLIINWTIYNEIHFKIQSSFNTSFKTLIEKWRPFCLGFSVLMSYRLRAYYDMDRIRTQLANFTKRQRNNSSSPSFVFHLLHLLQFHLRDRWQKGKLNVAAYSSCWIVVEDLGSYKNECCPVETSTKRVPHGCTVSQLLAAVQSVCCLWYTTPSLNPGGCTPCWYCWGDRSLYVVLDSVRLVYIHISIQVGVLFSVLMFVVSNLCLRASIR